MTACGGNPDDGKTPYLMVKILAGIFTMGSPGSEANHDNGETQHQVTLTKDFYMGRYEVTQEQCEAVMGNNPSHFTSAVAVESGTPGKLPVEKVSWYDAIVFCNKLSIKEGLSPAYSIGGKTNPDEWGAVPTGSNATWNAVIITTNSNGYRLPKEAQWEYACRVGTTTAYNTGDTISDNTGWYDANSGSKSHEVGEKQPNAFGLYDMHGNVWEWCWDWYGDYPTGAQTDHTGASSGSSRVGRGGGWIAPAAGVRSAYRVGGFPSGRDGGDPYSRYDFLGFHLVLPAQ